MSTLEELRSGAERLWHNLSEGWRHLVARASGALTRFHKPRSKGSESGPPAVAGAEWGLLAADMYDDGDKIVVRLEVPGMEQDDFDVSVADGMLIVRGEKRYQEERVEGGYRIAECAYGTFERALPLPEEVDPSGARARYRRGVLRIELPRQRTGRRTIAID